MRKDITKKFLGKENRYLSKMISKAIVSFISRKKINRVKKQIGCEVIEFMNAFSTKFTHLNINFSKSGYKIKEIVLKDGKSIEFNMTYCESDEFNSDFLLGETEVTQELYELVMGYNPSYFQGEAYPNSSQRPVEYVTWYDAIMFCNKLSELLGKNPYYEIKYIKHHDESGWKNNIRKASVEINEGANGFRLPLLKEWEYAAKAGTNNEYAGTNDYSELEEYAWFGESVDNGSTHPVATKKPNEWGLYDMSGNVDELCYDENNNSNRWGNGRVVCGGSCFLSISVVRDSNWCIMSQSPGERDECVGFRVSASLVN